MEKLHTIIPVILDWLQGRPAEAWYGLGIFIGSILAVIGVTAWIKRRHLKKYAGKLSTRLTILNVGFWGLVVAASQFVIDSITTNSQIFGPFIPKEWLAHATTVSMGALTVHTLATRLLKWWNGRKSHTPTAQAETSPEAASSAPGAPMVDIFTR